MTLLDGEAIKALIAEVAADFVSVRKVMAAYYAAFPIEDPEGDPHLGDFVVAELAKGGFDLPMK